MHKLLTFALAAGLFSTLALPAQAQLNEKRFYEFQNTSTPVNAVVHPDLPRFYEAPGSHPFTETMKLTPAYEKLHQLDANPTDYPPSYLTDWTGSSVHS